MAKDFRFVPDVKINTQVRLPETKPADRATTEGIQMNQTLPGLSGMSVRIHGGYIKACLDSNIPVDQDLALRGTFNDKSLKTPENPHGEIESRTLGSILPHLPDDTFAFQIIKTQTLARAFFFKAKITQTPDSRVFWVGNVDHIESQLVLRTKNGDCVALQKDDLVFNVDGKQVWPQPRVKAASAPAEAGQHLTLVK